MNTCPAVSQGCSSKYTHRVAQKSRALLSHSSWAQRQQGHTPSAPVGSPSWPLLVGGGLPKSLAFLHLDTSLQPSVFTWHPLLLSSHSLPLCVSVAKFPLFIRSQVILDWGPVQKPHFKLITSVKNLFPDMLTFWGTKGKTSYLLEEKQFILQCPPNRFYHLIPGHRQAKIVSPDPSLMTSSEDCWKSMIPEQSPSLIS